MLIETGTTIQNIYKWFYFICMYEGALYSFLPTKKDTNKVKIPNFSFFGKKMEFARYSNQGTPCNSWTYNVFPLDEFGVVENPKSRIFQEYKMHNCT